MNRYQNIRTIEQIDWLTWQPVDVATLLFIIQDEKLLLIRKKRGLGKGKINAPGGKVEAGESLQQAAIREVEEEIGVTPHDPVYVGDHRFQFTDGYSMHVHVFRASRYTGQEQESAEAIPLWVSQDHIPYEQMWADDELWIPPMLQGKGFSGHYLFAGDQLLDHRLQVGELAPKPCDNIQ